MRKILLILSLTVVGIVVIVALVTLSRVQGPTLQTTAPSARAEAETTYVDPLGRFSFRYPKRFGEVVKNPGSFHSGHSVSLRFNVPRQRVLRPNEPTGQFVISKGRVSVPFGACGFLHDPESSRDLFSEEEWGLVMRALPPLTADTFCKVIATEDHLEPNSPSLSGLDPTRLEVARLVDNNGHHEPQVIVCQVDSNVVLFHEQLMEYASERRGNSSWSNVFGCIRFLDGEYSSVQYVQQSLGEPMPEHLAAIREMVRSVTFGKVSNESPKAAATKAH